jgi:hypothetical protein
VSFTPASSIGSSGGGGGGVVTQGARDVTAQAWLVDGSAVTQPVSQVTSPWVTADNQTLVDNAPFTDGTSKVFPAGYILDETAGTALTENDIAAARIDSKRAVVGVIEDASTRGRRATVSSGGALLVQIGSGTVTQGSPPWDIEGDQSNNLADVGKPVKVGGRASVGGPPAAVTDGKRVNAFFDSVGRQVVAAGVSGAGTDGVSSAHVPRVADDSGNNGPLATALYGYNAGTNAFDLVRVANAGRIQVDASTTAVTQGTSPWVTNDPGLPDTLGQTTAAGSTSVVLASDQSAVPVTGPLTDTQLRASAVPVSLASAPLPTGAATEATLALMRADLDSMRASLNEIALTAIVHREVLEVAA